jgi:uncharacterized protein (TIGR02452 family)
MSNSFVARIDCWEDTKQRCRMLPLPAPSRKIQYTPDVPIEERYDRTTIEIYNMDTIDCALSLPYPRPLLLNMADDLIPGGVVRWGSGAQEESLFRRTNYHLTLLPSHYPILANEAIYSPGVSILKSSENTGWSILPEVKTADFLACPGIKFPRFVVNDRLTDSDVQLLERKIELILQIAQQFHHDTVVFGALGCGAWKNPPHHVAEIFRNVLHKHDGAIQHAVFAIIKSQHGETNFDIFSSVFHNA